MPIKNNVNYIITAIGHFRVSCMCRYGVMTGIHSSLLYFIFHCRVFQPLIAVRWSLKKRIDPGTLKVRGPLPVAFFIHLPRC